MKIMIGVQHLTGGGAERVAALWATGLAARGHQVVMVLGENRHRPSYPLAEQVKVYNIGFFTHEGLLGRIQRRSMRYIKPMVQRVYLRRLAHIFRQEQPEVFIGVLQPWAEWARQVMAQTGMLCPIINTEHNSFERPSEKPLTAKQAYQKFELNKQYDMVTVLTEADLRVIGDRLPRVRVMPNPLAFQPKIESATGRRDKVILAAGRLSVPFVKGFDLLIQVWGRIAPRFPDWQLQIAGGGKSKEVAYLQGLANKEGLSEQQFRLIGRQEDMQSVYRRCEVFVLSSRYEGFGLVLIEAMSQGAACIACDYNGRQREIITSPEEGLVCEADNVEALSAAMTRMLTDDAYRESIRKNAIERSKFYLLDNIVNNWENILKEIKQ